MFKIISAIPNPEVFAAHLNQVVAPQLKQDVSNYANKRMRTWMPFEAPLSANRPWTPGIMDDKVWTYISGVGAKHGMKVDVALFSKGGGITRHRDASYADYRSIGINLGACTFYYELCYPEFRWTGNAPASAPVERYELTGGEVFEFNCKNPHWVEDVSPDRWGINMWHVSSKERARFDKLPN